jgi:RNA polymerase sigma factor (sigma-70 family)
MPPTPEPWLAKLRDGDVEGAWSLFVDRYRRLIFAMIRRYTTEPDEVMDVFAHICERLRANELARLRKYPSDSSATAAFSTWLVAVLRNLIVDWFRARDGRSRAQAPSALSPLGKRIYDYVFLQGYSHRETREIILGESSAASARDDYQRALRDVHHEVFVGARGVVPRPVIMVPLTEAHAEAPEDLTGAETSAHLAEALDTLEPEVRLAVQLFVVEELAAPDIARAMGLHNAKAVYNKVYRGLSALRDALAARGIRKGDL